MILLHRYLGTQSLDENCIVGILIKIPNVKNVLITFLIYFEEVLCTLHIIQANK